MANPQLFDSNYPFSLKVVQIPAACSSQENVHIAVPGDTIVDIAKVYNVDLDALEGLNPQIMDPSTLNPYDCLEVPGNSCDSTSMTSILSGTTTSSASAPTGTTCTFTIKSSGGISCPVGQLSDGQIRLNESYPTAGFTLATVRSQILLARSV